MPLAPSIPPPGPNTNTKIKRLATQVFVGAYQGVTAASDIERLITNEEWDAKEIICTNMAIATKDIAGRTKIRELGNPAALEAAASGAILGGLIGGMSQLMLGASKRPSVLVQAQNPSLYEEEKMVVASKRPSILATVASHNIEGMDKTRLQKIGTALIPGSSAIICVFDEVLIKQSDYDANMQDHHEEMSDLTDHVVNKITENLRDGNDVAFHIVVDESTGDLSWTRTVIGDEAIQVRDIVLSHDGANMAVEDVTTKNNLTIDATTGEVVENKDAAQEILTETTIVTPESIATARTLLRNSVTAYEISYEDLVDDADHNITAGDQIYETGAVRDRGDGTHDVEYEKATIKGTESTYEHKIKLSHGATTPLLADNTKKEEQEEPNTSSEAHDPPGDKQVRHSITAAPTDPSGLRVSTNSLAPFDERRVDEQS